MMRIECPNCAATYPLSQNYAGRKVRCNRCAHVWRAPTELADAPDGAEAAAQIAAPSATATAAAATSSASHESSARGPVQSAAPGTASQGAKPGAPAQAETATPVQPATAAPRQSLSNKISNANPAEPQSGVNRDGGAALRSGNPPGKASATGMQATSPADNQAERFDLRPDPELALHRSAASPRAVPGPAPQTRAGSSDAARSAASLEGGSAGYDPHIDTLAVDRTAPELRASTDDTWDDDSLDADDGWDMGEPGTVRHGPGRAGQIGVAADPAHQTSYGKDADFSDDSFDEPVHDDAEFDDGRFATRNGAGHAIGDADFGTPYDDDPRYQDARFDDPESDAEADLHGHRAGPLNEQAYASRQPRVRSASKGMIIGGWTALLAAIVIVAGGGIAARNQIAGVLPGAAGLYKAMGFEINTRGFVIENVAYVWVNDRKGRPALEISGEIRNVADNELLVPDVVFALLGKNGSELFHWATPVRLKPLDAGGTSRFRTTIPAPPESVRGLEVRFAKATS